MSIFGRKAKKQSTDALPPELQQYYKPSRGDQLKRTALLVLPVLSIAIIAAGLIWGGWWLTHRTTVSNKKAPNQVAQQNQTTTNSQTTPKPKSAAPSPSTTTKPKPALALVNTGPSELTLVLPLMAAVLAAGAYELKQRARTVEIR